MSANTACLSILRHRCRMRVRHAFDILWYLGTAALAIATAAAQAAPPALFVPARSSYAEAAAVPPGDSPLELLRSRAISLDRTAVGELLRLSKPSASRSAAGDATVLLNLFPDTALPLLVTDVQPTHDGVGIHWFGSVQNADRAPSGEVILTWYQGAMAGFVRLANGEYYRLFFPAFGEGEVRQLQFRGYPGGPVDFVTPKTEAQNASNGAAEAGLAKPVASGMNTAEAEDGWRFGSPREAGATSVLTVMIAFGANMSTGGHESYRNSYANNIVAEANGIFDRSDTGIRLQLVQTVTTDWNDLKTYSRDHYESTLAALTSSNDGKIDEIHPVRDQYGADLVSMVVAPTIPGGTFVVGIANLLGKNQEAVSSLAFSVVHRDYAGGPSYAFAHEIGHNLGLVHDDDNGGARGGLHPYSKGYQQKLFSPKFFTVMAYESGCNGCEAVPNFSNPNVNYHSIPMGVPDAIDAARTLRYVRTFASEWRPDMPPPSCTYQLSVSSSLELSGQGGDHGIGVRTGIGCAWNATSSEPWATFLPPAAGTGDCTATLRLADNTTLDKRTVNLLIAGKAVVVQQNPRLCEASVPSMTLGSAATVAEANLTLGNPCRFQVTSQADWISPVDGIQQSGAQTVKVKLAIDENKTGVARIGRVTIANYTFEVLQNSLPRVCAYSLPITSLQVPAIGGVYSAAVVSDPGCPWTASYSGDVNFWPRVANGSGSSSLPLTITSNNSESPRTGTVNIEGNSFTVVQAARLLKCVYSFERKVFEVPFSGGRLDVKVSTTPDCSTSLIYPLDWMQRVTEVSGDGVLNAVFNVSPNPNAYTRVGTLTAGTATASVRQAGVPPPANCSYIVSPATIDFVAGSASRQISVETAAACPWNVETEANWLSASIRSGTGSATLELRAAANSGSLPRSGTVSIGGGTIAVTQSAMPAVQLLSPRPQVVVLQSRPLSSALAKAAISVTAGGADLPIKLGPLLVTWLKESIAATTTQKPFEMSAMSGTMDPGLYETTLTVSNPGGAMAPAKIPVFFQLRSFHMARVTPQSLSFRAQLGSNPPLQSLRLRQLSKAPTVKTIVGSGEWLSAKAVPQDGGFRVDVTVNSALLPVGIYDAAVTISCELDCLPTVVPVRLALEARHGAEGAPPPEIASGGVVNGASFEQGISSGSWMSVFGKTFASDSRLWDTPDFDGDRFPLQLDGVRVTVAGLPAAVNYISPGQVNFQAPSGLPAGWVAVEVETPAGKDMAYAYAAPEVPGIFMFDAQRQVAALHPDGTPARKPRTANDEGRIAKPGDILAIYGTGFGPTNPDVPAGRMFSGAAPLANPGFPFVYVGGVRAEVRFVGLSAAGLNQLNVVIPPLPSGAYEVVVVFDGVAVQPGLILEVEP